MLTITKRFWNSSDEVWQSTPYMVKQHSTLFANGRDVWRVTVVVVPIQGKRKGDDDKMSFYPMGVRFELVHGYQATEAYRAEPGYEYHIPGTTMFYAFPTNDKPGKPGKPARCSEHAPWTRGPRTTDAGRGNLGLKPPRVDKAKEAVPITPWIEAAANQAEAAYEAYRESLRAAA